jgi:hypothetical protein
LQSSKQRHLSFPDWVHRFTNVSHLLITFASSANFYIYFAKYGRRSPFANASGKAFSPGLPDVIFSNQKSQFGQILESLAMKVVGKFYGHLVYFTAISYIFAIWYILLSFWYIFHVLVYCTKKIWQPCFSQSYGRELQRRCCKNLARNK